MNATGVEHRAERVASLIELAVSERSLEHFTDQALEVVERTDRGQWCGEGIVSRATRGTDDESILDGVEGDPLLEELTGELAIGAAYAAEDAGGLDVKGEEGSDVVPAR